MSNTKKFLIIVYTVMLVISLQLNTSLTHKMNNGFSLTQLMENIFVPEAYATWEQDYGLLPCWYDGYICTIIINPEVGCIWGEDYGCR